MSEQKGFTLINEQNGNLAFRILPFHDNVFFDHLQRLNYYSIILLTEASGFLRSDFSEFAIEKDNLLCFAPFQPFMIQSDQNIKGIALHFHPEFFCILKHQEEVSCNGIVFNNIYQSPIIPFSEEDRLDFLRSVDEILKETKNKGVAGNELIISYLKIILIKATRIKQKVLNKDSPNKKDLAEPILIQNLKNAIEINFRQMHTPSEYANLLNINPRNLAAITKKYFQKTLTDLISERIIIEAKRELYLTSKPVREIAYELGFSDEFYFSRFFKNSTDIAPSVYRETVGFARAEVK